MKEGLVAVTEGAASECHALLDSNRFPPLADLRPVRRDTILRLQKEDFDRTTKDPQSVALGLWKRGRLAGLIAFRKLDFDTSLFRFPCYSLAHFQVADDADSSTRLQLLRAAEKELKTRGAVFVSARVHGLDVTAIAALQNSGFAYMDTTMRYAFDLRSSPLPEMQSTVPLREATKEDESALVQIAATYTENRFHYDVRIPRDKADEMYRLWLVNSLRGDADWIVVAALEGKPVGFTTTKDHPELLTENGGTVGEMVFSAVSPDARGRDVYTSMIHAGLKHYYRKSELVYLGCLASNAAVQRAWQKLGFRVTSAACSFHRWLRLPDD